MIRKYNYTNRKRIKKNTIQINLDISRKVFQFDCSFQFQDLNFPPDAKLFVEPYYKSNFMRFEFGSINNITTPDDTTLTDFVGIEIFYFRVKVVDVSGRILGLVSGLKSMDDDAGKMNKISILHVIPVELGQKLYELNFEGEGNVPVLEVNKRIYNREIVKSDIFISTIYPSVIREVAYEIIKDETEWNESDDLWQGYWIKFFKTVLKVSGPIPNKNSEDHEKTEFLREITNSFCNAEKVRTRFEHLNVL